MNPWEVVGVLAAVFVGLALALVGLIVVVVLVRGVWAALQPKKPGPRSVSIFRSEGDGRE